MTLYFHLLFIIIIFYLFICCFLFIYLLLGYTIRIPEEALFVENNEYAKFVNLLTLMIHV